MGLWFLRFAGLGTLFSALQIRLNHGQFTGHLCVVTQRQDKVLKRRRNTHRIEGTRGRAEKSKREIDFSQPKKKLKAHNGVGPILPTLVGHQYSVWSYRANESYVNRPVVASVYNESSNPFKDTTEIF